MPIQLSYTDAAEGFVAPLSHWVTVTCNIDIANLSIFFQLTGYVSLAAKNAGKQPIGTRSITATFAQLGLTGASTLVQTNNALYTYALTFVETISPGVTLQFFLGGTIV